MDVVNPLLMAWKEKPRPREKPEVLSLGSRVENISPAEDGAPGSRIQKTPRSERRESDGRKSTGSREQLQGNRQARCRLERVMMQEEQNVGTAEQWARILGRNLSSLAGIALLIPGLATLLSGVLGVVLVLLGINLFVTGTTGCCPIYRRLGCTTRQIEAEQDDVLMERWRRTNHNGSVHEGWKHRVLIVLYCVPMIAVVIWLVLRVRGS